MKEIQGEGEDRGRRLWGGDGAQSRGVNMHLEPPGPLPSVQGLWLPGQVRHSESENSLAICRPSHPFARTICCLHHRRRRRAPTWDQDRPASRFAGTHILHFARC